MAADPSGRVGGLSRLHGRRRCFLRENGDAALVIHWDAPGYVVAFTTRAGGVSEGPFDSLNLGGRRDDPARVAENRRRACDALGLDASRLTVNRQRHTPTIDPPDEPGRHVTVALLAPHPRCGRTVRRARWMLLREW
jgi:hypothetical protein